PPRVLNWMSHQLSRWSAGAEHLIRPRFEIMSRGPLWTLRGVGILVQALALALPILIPGRNTPFVIVILVFAIGLLEADDSLIEVGHTLVVAQMALTVWAWDTVSRTLQRALQWMWA